MIKKRVPRKFPASSNRSRKFSKASGSEKPGRQRRANAKPDAQPLKPSMSVNKAEMVAEMIEKLAAISDPLEFEFARLEAAQKSGIRIGVIDRAVAKKRRELGLEVDDQGQGRAIKIEDVMPWHEPVDGDELANTLVAEIKTYVILPDHAVDTIALWILHTWVVNAFTVTPRLAITAPTNGCGKTTVLRLLENLTRRPKRTGNISEAVLFRLIEQVQPTVLLDETEKYINHGTPLHALLNEGHCKGATVLRVLGEKLELREFAIFGAVGFSRVGKMPPDLEQRSVVIEMERRRADEALSVLREGERPEALHLLARMCARWADDNFNLVADQDPDTGMINREADNWRALFAIADVIGADWPTRIRAAAAILAPREIEMIGPMVLGDILAVFNEKQTDRLASVDICDALTAMEGRPWAEWRVSKGASPKPLTPNQLARLLKPFKIMTNTTIRVGSRTVKGYHHHQFEAAWQRYLPEGLPPERSHGNTPDEMGASGTFQSVTPDSVVPLDVTDQNHEKPAPNQACDLVTDPEGVVARDDDDRSCRQCGGRLDGSEQLYQINGALIWLHPECRVHYLRDHPT